MQTTLRIRDDIYRRAKARASELGLSLTRFFEEAVEHRLESANQTPEERIVLPVSTASGSVLTFDELNSRIRAEDEAHDESFR